MSSGAYLRVAAVAETLDVSPRTVRRWIDAGVLPAIRLPGGQLRIPAADFATFRTACKLSPLDAAGGHRANGPALTPEVESDA